MKSVETVSAMDLIMGAAEEDSAKSDEDEGPRFRLAKDRPPACDAYTRGPHGNRHE